MMTRDELRKRFSGDLTRVVGARLETSTSSRPGSPRSEDGFVATIVADDARHGELRAYFARMGAEALTKAMTATSADPSDDAVIGCLRDLCAQALGTIDKRTVGASLMIASVQTASEMPGADGALFIEIVLKGHECPLHLALVGDLEIAASDADAGPRARSKTLDVIMDIDLPLVVRFGRTELSLKALTALGPGSVIDLGRSPDEPVDVLISNRVVARGEVVIVSGNYGVRVRDVISPAERARSLEAELS